MIQDIPLEEETTAHTKMLNITGEWHLVICCGTKIRLFTDVLKRIVCIGISLQITLMKECSAAHIGVYVSGTEVNELTDLCVMQLA